MKGAGEFRVVLVTAPNLKVARHLAQRALAAAPWTVRKIAIKTFKQAVFFGISFVLFGVVRANGAVMAPLIILVLTLLGIRFPLALLGLDRWQADAIWWSFPLSAAVAVLLAFVYYTMGGWRAARMISAPHGPGAAAAAPSTVE